MQFVTGDRVWYKVSGLGDVPPIWVAVVVVSANHARVGVRAGSSRVRYVKYSRLTRDEPPPGVTVIGSVRAQISPLQFPGTV